jgi:hypothetical protein
MHQKIAKKSHFDLTFAALNIIENATFVTILMGKYPASLRVYDFKR